LKIDKVTRKWIRNASDERAASRGCRFVQSRADHVIEFFAKFLRLYEGDHAGEAFALLPWQVEILSRIFGWVKHSDHFKRDVRRFRKAGIWVPKKNGKSPTAAGVGLYLLLADQEPGQKVFSAAKDGKQAGIVHTHARKMVEMSPDLRSVCKINKTTGGIYHPGSNSVYNILSGDNIEGQEGLNGSVIIDETHVVDERLANRLEYMGASRAQPLQIEFSTAGDNPLSYGKKQYDYGKLVESGDRDDDGFFFACYEASQQATDEECCDPETWKKANPSWGHTINPEEFSESLNRAKRSLSDWQKFKMYRFNIWATGESPFLKMHEWKNCSKFKPEDLIGLPCWAGLDLAKCRDLTALVLVFRDGDEYFLLPHFFLPEDTARDLEGVIPFKEWASRGLVELTPGGTCDYAFVRNRFRELHETYGIQELAYDPYNAEETTQIIEQGSADKNGKSIEEGTGVPRFLFAQTVANFAGPTGDFERLVINGQIHHNDHLILTWQAGNVAVRVDANNNKRPVKQKHGDHRTIDGIVAAIMGLQRALTGTDTTSIYNESGAMFL
jgi:phage terminase large subunit-like protein